MFRPSATLISYCFSGAIAGAFSAFIFAIIHDIFISDIWFSLPAMLFGGVLCGFCMAWSFRLLFENPKLKHWLNYNLLYVFLFIILGTLSVIFFEPVTSAAELINRNELPRELIKQAAPMTIAFTIGSAFLLSFIYSRKIVHQLAILITCIVLVVLLGLNVSLIGLVFFPSDMLYLVLEMYVLIIVINVAYVVAFIFLQWNSLNAVQT